MKIVISALVAVVLLLGQSPQEGHITLLGKDVPYLGSAVPAKAERLPLLVFLPEQDAKAVFAKWQPVAQSRGWRLVVPEFARDLPPWTDFAAKALDTIVADYAARASVDMAAVYLAGEGNGASGVFFEVSRIPDLWAAALAIGGSPKAAIDSNRLFAVNAAATPVLWIFRDQDRSTLEPLAARLSNAGCNLTTRSTTGATVAQTLDWLAGHRRELLPQKVDCETGNAAFGRCGWIDITRLDPTQRNEVLPSTRIEPGSGAFLALGGFGFDVSAPGPGLLVSWLPENYKGPLKLEDRIVSIAGKEIEQARDYVQFMEQAKEEKPLAIMVLRGKQHLRVETTLKIPARDEVFTGRLQAEFLPADREIQVISRGVSEIRVGVPGQFTPARVTWNGLEAVKAEAPGTWTLKFADDKITVSKKWGQTAISQTARNGVSPHFSQAPRK